jgi:hypothetical protein
MRKPVRPVRTVVGMVAGRAAGCSRLARRVVKLQLVLQVAGARAFPLPRRQKGMPTPVGRLRRRAANRQPEIARTFRDFGQVKQRTTWGFLPCDVAASIGETRNPTGRWRKFSTSVGVGVQASAVTLTQITRRVWSAPRCTCASGAGIARGEARIPAASSQVRQVERGRRRNLRGR